MTMSGRLSRWFWLRLLRMAPRDIVDLHGHLQHVDESVRHLAECVGYALENAERRDGYPVHPADVFDEEWGK